MTSIQEISELCKRQLTPKGDEGFPHIAEVVSTAKQEYSYQLWVQNRDMWRNEGENSIPSYLLTSTDLDIVENKADISKLSPLRSFPNHTWIQRLSPEGIDCDGCRYTIMDLNTWNLLCDDDSRTEDSKAAVPIGKQIWFPEGVFGRINKAQMFFADISGDQIDDDVEIDEAMGALVRRGVMDIYKQRYQADETNNTNSLV